MQDRRSRFRSLFTKSNCNSTATQWWCSAPSASASPWASRTRTVPPMAWCSLAWAAALALITGPRTTLQTTSLVRGQGQGEAQASRWLWDLKLSSGPQACAAVPRSSCMPVPAWTTPSAPGQQRTSCCGGLGRGGGREKLPGFPTSALPELGSWRGCRGGRGFASAPALVSTQRSRAGLPL